MSLMAVSCQKEFFDPELHLDESSIEVKAEGATLKVGYTIDNPSDMLRLRYDYTVTWIADVDISVPGEVVIVISPNESPEGRECEIEFSYGDSDETLEIRQEGKEEEEPVEHEDLEVEIKEVLETSVVFDVTPLDKSMTYTVMSIPKEMNDELGDDKQLVDEIMNFYIEAAVAEQISLEEYFEKYGVLTHGDVKSGKIDALKPDTEYVLLAFGLNTSGDLLSEMYRIPFQTKAFEMTDVTFSFELKIDGPDIEMTVTPSKDDVPYFSGVLAAEEYDAESMSDYAQAQVDMYISLLTGLGGLSLKDALDKILVSGPYTFDTELKAESEYYAYSIAVNTSGYVCSIPSVEKFVTGSVSGSDNEISIELSYINLDKVDYTITTTNDDQYFFTVKEKSAFEGMSDDEILESLTLAVFSWDLYSGDQHGTYEYLSPGVEYYAIIFGYYGGAVTTEMIKEEFTTLTTPDDPTKFTFTSSVSDITMTGAKVSVTGTPHTVMYYWDICPVYFTEEDVESFLESYLEELFETSEFYSSRDIFFKINGSRHTDSNDFTELMDGTEYKPYAVSIDENTWEYACDFTFGEPFRTKEHVISDATVTAKYDKYFDIDQLADEYGGEFESFRGQNRYYLRVDVETTGSVTKTYTAALRGDMTDAQSISDAMIISDLVTNKMGLTDKICEFALGYDTDVTILSVAVDDKGNYSRVFRGLVNLGKDGVSDISEFEPVQTSKAVKTAFSHDSGRYAANREVKPFKEYDERVRALKTRGEVSSRKSAPLNRPLDISGKIKTEIRFYSESER